MKLHMGHRILLVFLVCLFTVSVFCACSSQPDAPKGPQDVLAFPGTSWDMTPDALIKSLKLKAGTYETEETTLEESTNRCGTYAIGVENYSLFGEKCRVVFQFLDYTGDHYGLDYIRVFLPEDYHSEEVRKAMTEIYGEPTESSEHVVLWESEIQRGDVLEDEAFQALDDYTAEYSKQLCLSHVRFTDGTENLTSWPTILGPGIEYGSYLTTALHYTQPESYTPPVS